MEHHLGVKRVALFRRFLARERDANGRLVFTECPNLGEQGCTIHEFRPLSCRLYGHFRGESADLFEHCVFRGQETVLPDAQEHLLSPGQPKLTELNIEYLTYFPALAAKHPLAPLKEPQTELETASHLMVIGQYAQAAEKLRKLRVEHSSANIFLMLADCYGHLEDFDNAILTLEEAITGSPDNPELHFRKGSNLFRAGRFPEAREALRHSVCLAPDRRNAQGLLGFLCQLGGDLEAAHRHLTRAVELEDEPGPYRLQLGLVLASLGQSEEAHRMLTLAQDYEPSLEQARLALAQLSGEVRPPGGEP